MQILTIFLESILLTACVLVTAVLMTMDEPQRSLRQRWELVSMVALGSFVSGCLAFGLFVRVVSLLTGIPV